MVSMFDHNPLIFRVSRVQVEESSPYECIDKRHGIPIEQKDFEKVTNL